MAAARDLRSVMGVSDSSLCSSAIVMRMRLVIRYAYSASNWFGSMRSASRNSPLYSGTSSSGIYSLPLSPMTGSSTVSVSTASYHLTLEPTPEKAARLRASIELDVSANRPYRLYGLSTRHVSGQEYVEVGKVRLL